MLIDFLEVFLADVGVVLSRDQAPVAQHLLNATQIAPAVQEMRGKGMPEGMGAEFLPQSGLPDPLADDSPGPSIRQAPAPVIQK